MIQMRMAPSLFKMATSSCVPPWQRTASVTKTCIGALQVVFVQNIYCSEEVLSSALPHSLCQRSQKAEQVWVDIV